MRVRLATIVALICSSFAVAQTTRPTLRYVGGDISMLPELERFGATYRDAQGKQADAIAILRDAGWNLFRVRVFVDPTSDFDKSWGATQSLPMMRKLAKRIQAAGGDVFLCIHYSDTWADPEHQTKPKAWADLPFDQLEQRVHDYTADVLKQLKDDGVTPTVVQVGNEITAGMLWPDGKVGGRMTEAEREAQFAKLSRLIAAGVRAVREASAPEHPIRIAIHTHGGGKVKLGPTFFSRLKDVDYDLIGVSFYPVYGETLDFLAGQIRDLRATFKKDVFVAETSYPSREIEIDAKYRKFLKWPATIEGQSTFARELRETVSDAGGIGIQWWYPEATPVKGHAVYHDGGEGVFDREGVLLPAAAGLAR